MSSSESVSPHPDKVCDIVMKGGITSGVVYPLALVELSKKYRFANIGGTSAGAIAAAAAAAAEYGRGAPSAGFDCLKAVPDEIGEKLLSLFQPTPNLRPLFEIFIAVLKGRDACEKGWGAVSAAVRGYFENARNGALVGFGIAVLIGLLTGGGVSNIFAFGLIFALLGAAAALALRILKALTQDLPENDYGLCPGLYQEGGEPEGFTEWLDKLVSEASGRGKTADPLTFGNLLEPPGDRPPIRLAMMTTCLTERRPYTLSTEGVEKAERLDGLYRDDAPFVFEKTEWSKLFPERIVNFMSRDESRVSTPKGQTGEFYRFPKMKDLPIVVAARMSLSFPGLICAVPLWRRDCSYNEENKQEREKFRRCLFSDGGLSSNFPIHFFDRLLPTSPTFAISLDEFDAQRSNDGRHTWLTSTPEDGVNIQLQDFKGLLGFLLRLVDSAKDWQDNLQSVLPGYRERIVHIGLNPQEGGLNLVMEKTTIDALVGYGAEAGTRLCKDFDFDAHRWRRFLVAMARLEETLDEVKQAYDETDQPADSFVKFLAQCDKPAQYPQKPEVIEAMRQRAKSLVALAASWRLPPTVRNNGDIPKPDASLRITAKP